MPLYCANADQKYNLQAVFLRQEGLVECETRRFSTCIANELGRRVYEIIEAREDARRVELESKRQEAKTQEVQKKPSNTDVDNKVGGDEMTSKGNAKDSR